MTEAEWLAAIELKPMLDFIEPSASKRKRQLFVCACCRRVEHLLIDEEARDALEAAERFADEWSLWNTAETYLEKIGKAGGVPLYRMVGTPTSAAYHAVTMALMPDFPLRNSYSHPHYSISLAAATESGEPKNSDAWQVAYNAEAASMANLLRDIIGNPFRPVTVKPGWQTSNVVGLAQAIYDERAFDRMPILADALEDAGCTNADMLSHCRQASQHVRGCSVVDLLLGKS